MTSGLAFGSVIFALIAGWFLLNGFSMEVAVVTEAGTVANLQLMHMRSMNVAVGLGSAVVSAILAIGAAIVTAIQQASAPPE